MMVRPIFAEAALEEASSSGVQMNRARGTLLL
jgi:hypothetical protein